MRAAWERRGSITEEEGVRGLVSFSGATVGGTSRRKRKGKKEEARGLVFRGPRSVAHAASLEHPQRTVPLAIQPEEPTAAAAGTERAGCGGGEGV